MPGAVTDDRRSDELLHDNRHCLAPALNVGSVSGTFGTMKKIAQIMDTDSEPDGGEPVPEVCADIEFDNVSFAYAGGQDVVKNLSVKIPMGKVTAVIGGTVRENIAYGLDREVSDEELAETARRANFSGGQGQCISIARAMLRNADYLLLDEATSNPDVVSETEVTGAMDELMRDKTTIMIAHNYAATRNADYIIVMKDGAVEAAGTPDELLKTNEYYRMFVKTL